MSIEFFGFKVDYLTFFGLSAQFLFFLRFIYQWIVSEKKKESYIPIEFWYFSLIGGVLITIYAYLRKDLVFFIGQIFAIFIYSRNLYLIKKNQSDHQKKYQTINPVKKLFINLFVSRIGEIIGRLKVKSLLDVGCGEGQLIKKIKKKHPDLDITAFDICPKAISIARENPRGIKFIRADINNLEELFRKDHFDLTLVLEVLEHLEDPDRTIKFLKNISGEYFLFSVPHEPWFSLGNLVFGKNITRYGKDRDHRNFWSRGEFSDFIKREYRIIKIYSLLFWTVVLAKKK